MLLSLGGWVFRVQPADVDESELPGEAPQAHVLRLAHSKARRVAEQAEPGDLVVAADTTVADGKRIFGKPADHQEARSMLRSLRGREHQVYTALVVLRLPDQLGHSEIWAQDVVQTGVHMRDYSDAEIEAYIHTNDPMDKAGAYAIQHPVFHPVERLSGCYTNVVGLPICRLARFLSVLGLPASQPLPGRCVEKGYPDDYMKCDFPAGLAE